MNAAETHYQHEQGIEDSVEQFVEDTMARGKEVNDKKLAMVMAENSAASIDWLDGINALLPKVFFGQKLKISDMMENEWGVDCELFAVGAFFVFYGSRLVLTKY